TPLTDVVDGRLMVTGGPENPRHDDLDRAFRTLLDAPLRAVVVFHREARTVAGRLFFDVFVCRSRIGSAFHPERAEKQVAGGKILGLFPELRHLRRCRSRCQSGANLRGRAAQHDSRQPRDSYALESNRLHQLFSFFFSHATSIACFGSSATIASETVSVFRLTGTFTSYRISSADELRRSNGTRNRRNTPSTAALAFAGSFNVIFKSKTVCGSGSIDSTTQSTPRTNTVANTARRYDPTPEARPRANVESITPASFGSSILARYRISPAAPTMPKARARLAPTTSMTMAPTIATERKSTTLNPSHTALLYGVFLL